MGIKVARRPAERMGAELDRETLMNRHAWIILSLAALFGLRAPLCVFACMDTGGSAPAETTAHDSGQSAPCHGSGSSSPESPPSPVDHECDCDQTQLVLTKGDAKRAADALELPTPSLAVVLPLSPVDPSSSPRLWRRHEALPPPDVLLLKSTLLI